MEFRRITVRGSAEFKSYLTLEASKEGKSVSELVRQRCESRSGADEALLAELTKELRLSVQSAKQSIAEGIAAVHETLREARMSKAPK